MGKYGSHQFRSLLIIGAIEGDRSKGMAPETPLPFALQRFPKLLLNFHGPMSPLGTNPAMCVSYEAAVPHHVRTQDGGQFSLNVGRGHGTPSRKSTEGQFVNRRIRENLPQVGVRWKKGPGPRGTVGGIWRRGKSNPPVKPLRSVIDFDPLRRSMSWAIDDMLRSKKRGTGLIKSR